MWSVVGIIGLLVLAVVLLYLPPVQNLVVKKALESVNKSGDMHISVKKLRLGFPLDLTIDSLSMQAPGMDIAAGKAAADIAFMPLLGGNAVVRDLSVNDAIINLGTPDSALYMRSSVKLARLEDTNVGLFSNHIDIGRLTASGGDISMIMTPDTVPAPKSESAPATWEINLDKARLEKIGYRMQMLPTIDSLACNLPVAELTNGEISLRHNTINIGEIAISGVDATYIVPTQEYIASHPAPVIQADTTGTVVTPWSITAAKLRLDGSHALYAAKGAIPSENFDPAYIEASEIHIAVDSFSNRGSEIRVPLTRLSARERCGIALDASGLFEMDSLSLQAHGFSINTPASKITLDAMMGLDTVNPPLDVRLSASISPDDLKKLTPAAAAPIAATLPPYTPLDLQADIEGRMNNLDIKRLSADLPRHISIAVTGTIADYSDINRAVGNLRITGSLPNSNFIKPALFDAKTGRQVNLPPLRLLGTTSLNRGVIAGTLKAVTGKGDVALDARWDNRREAYEVNLDMNTFPIQSILPLAGARDIDATVAVTGLGIDPFSPKTKATAKIALDHVEYMGRNYDDVTLDAIVADGHAAIEALSRNRNANFSLKADGNLSGDTYDWNFDGNIRHIDLRALALSDTTADGSITLSGNARLRPAVAATRRTSARPMTIYANVNIADLYWHMPGDAVNANDIAIEFNADTTLTDAALTNRDLALKFYAPVPLDTLTKRFGWAAMVLNRDMERRRLAIDTLQRALPPFSLNLQAGTDNILSNYLLGSDISFQTLHVNALNDSLLTLNAYCDGVKSGETKLDTLTLSMKQRNNYMLYEAKMRNRPGTFDQFASVDAKGYINADRIALIFKQQNLAGETGYSLGAMARVDDKNTIELRFVPYHPVIGYKDWEINKDNFIRYNLQSQHLDANLDLHNSVSSVHLFTEHQENDSLQEDVILKVKDIKLSDWLALNPFAPPITGDLSADMRLSWQKPDLNGNGTVSLTGFNYGKKKVGDFELALDVSTNTAGTIRANTSLMVNGVKAITATGNLNDSTAEHPFLLDFKMIRFPLSVANPFLPQGTASLSGVLNGEMDITGDMANPIFNGFLDFDTTTVNVEMLGTPFRFSEDKIPVTDNVVRFDNFTITGVNNNPLGINGTVDMSSMASPKLDLALQARNMQIVGSKKQRRSQVYGKAFIDLDAKVKGSMQFLDVDAAMNLLPGTNVTYVMADAVNELTSRSNQDMVKFVNFKDTTVVADADTIASPSMMMNLDARLTISTGTTVNVELDPQGKSKVQLHSSGTVNYTTDYMNDEHFTGRININNGFVKYSVPVIGEKSFDFKEGSYVEFSGDMLNPTLHVLAYDQIRANVAQDGTNSRVVNFDVGLTVTGTLNQMNVVFDLECPDDITIANELKSMSPEQRANQAMNLLLYNTYRSGGTQTISSGNAGTNALFNFLESQLNSWASSAIKGVDISFGINQYDKTVNGANTTAMNYSYRVSKSLFDDRFKIVVGGNYTTDAEADENFAQNLIADISFEYMLNKAGTMYVRLFRHTGYESILEGEITQTGVGFVYKKKIGRLSELFNFMHKRPETPQMQPPQQGLPAQAAPAQVPPPGDRPVPKTDNTQKSAIKPDNTDHENETDR